MKRLVFDLIVDAVIVLCFLSAAHGCCNIDPKDCVSLTPHCLAEAPDGGP